MNVAVETRVIENEEGLPIHLEVRRPREETPSAAVIVAHGFKGFKRWGFFPYLGERLAAEGWAAITFDFSHNGVGGGGEEFDRLDLFETNTYTRECGDLIRVLEYAVEQESPRGAGGLPIGLIGHSRAAVPVMVAAAEREEVSAVVTWNGVARLLRVTEGQLRRWEEDGRMEFTNARTGQRMAMTYDFVVDAREHEGRLDPVHNAARMRAPQLVLHGDRDLAVDPAEAELLLAGRSEPTRLRWIEGGTHTFGAVHPFAGSTPALERAVQETIAFLHRHLRR